MELSSSIIATPHAQRSQAKLQLEVGTSTSILLLKTLIDAVEEVLKTPVQGPVKREDETIICKTEWKKSHVLRRCGQKIEKIF